jgi:hypothetical protein
VSGNLGVEQLAMITFRIIIDWLSAGKAYGLTAVLTEKFKLERLRMFKSTNPLKRFSSGINVKIRILFIRTGRTERKTENITPFAKTVRKYSQLTFRLKFI